ncbi:MAG: DUF4097 family beta strand repeat protein [Bryobacterales bacterium]|nr:DUF4097 family beta strand repeat protein [Bryobacterales bacterium]
MFRRPWLSIFLTALIPGVGCELAEFGGSSRFQEEFHKVVPMQAGGRLYLESFNGSVDVSGWDREEADITATKYASTQSAVSAMDVDVVASGDSLRIRSIRPSERWGNMGVRYTIRVPRKTALERVQTSNGAIDVSNLEAPARVMTSNGAVRVDNVTGGLEATTSNGSIRAAAGSVEDGRPLRLTTSNGSVELSVDRLGSGGAYVKTSNGSITVNLPASISLDVYASTSNARISNDFEDAFRGRSDRRRLEGSIGSGGPRLELATSNGSIRLRKR